ncbi:MAG TPA: hypothetical protein VHD15_01800 [Hyphomicrobiales bacterium]|nr:hypothetical protein [Hyphomicrobiales bacterium]
MDVPASPQRHGRPSTPADLAGILLASLQALAAAGEVDAACRLAGEACAALRRCDAGTWHRFNALLHRLVRDLP